MLFETIKEQEVLKSKDQFYQMECNLRHTEVMQVACPLIIVYLSVNTNWVWDNKFFCFVHYAIYNSKKKTLYVEVTEL